MSEAVIEALRFVESTVGCGDLETLCYVFAVKFTELDNGRGLYDARAWCVANRGVLFINKGGVWCPRI